MNLCARHTYCCVKNSSHKMQNNKRTSYGIARTMGGFGYTKIARQSEQTIYMDIVIVYFIKHKKF